MRAVAEQLLTLLAAALGTALLIPLAQRVALRVGLVDRPAPHKFHANPTPYLGGAAVALAVLGALGVELAVRPSIRGQALAVCLGASATGAVGLLDDWLTVGRLPRLAVEAGAAVGLWAAGIRLAPTGVWPVDLAITVGFVIVLTNAVNLMDNMDGLAAGTVGLAALFLYAVAAHEGQDLVSLMTLLVAGGCLGFLAYNFPPARIFLGDAGTLFLGFLLSAIVIKLRVYGASVVTRAAVPGLIVLVPLFDTTLVVVSRWRAGKPILVGGTDHSSHRMVALGANPRTVALLTYAAGATCGALGLLILLVDRAVFTWATLACLGVGCLTLLRFLEHAYRHGQARSGTPAALRARERI